MTNSDDAADRYTGPLDNIDADPTLDAPALCTRCGRPLVPGCCPTVPDPDDDHPRWHEAFEEMFVQTNPATDDEEDDA